MSGGTAALVVTARDVRVLRFLAGLRVATLPQLATLMGCAQDTARGRLTRLQQVGLLDARRMGPLSPRMLTCTQRALDLIGSAHPVGQWATGGLAHGLAVTDVALGFTLEGLTVVSERDMRLVDANRSMSPVWAFVTDDDTRRFPDLVLAHGGPGHDVAIEVELSPKPSLGFMTRLLAQYRASGRYRQVRYLVPETDRALVGFVEGARRAALVNAGPCDITVEPWTPIHALPGWLHHAGDTPRGIGARYELVGDQP